MLNASSYASASTGHQHTNSDYRRLTKVIHGMVQQRFFPFEPCLRWQAESTTHKLIHHIARHAPLVHLGVQSQSVPCCGVIFTVQGDVDLLMDEADVQIRPADTPGEANQPVHSQRALILPLGRLWQGSERDEKINEQLDLVHEAPDLGLEGGVNRWRRLEHGSQLGDKVRA